MVKEIWKKIFTENYLGQSAEAKELEGFLKKTYKDMSYIPWATMERMLYQQDPEAQVDVIRNNEGGFVFPNIMVNHTNDAGAVTDITMFSHMVVVQVTFLGKTVEEIMPVQDKKYDAVKTIDQNLVNKSIQRAKAKAVARVTGLALKLYEGKDLQFEDDAPTIPLTQPEKEFTVNPTTGELVQPVVETVVVTPVVVPPVVVPPTVPADELLTIATALHGNQELLVGVQRINVSIAKKFNFVLDINEDIPVIVQKLSQLANPKVTYNAILKQSGKL